MWRGTERLGGGCSERDICGEEGYEGYMCGEGGRYMWRETERGRER